MSARPVFLKRVGCLGLLAILSCGLFLFFTPDVLQMHVRMPAAAEPAKPPPSLNWAEIPTGHYVMSGNVYYRDLQSALRAAHSEDCPRLEIVP